MKLDDDFVYNNEDESDMGALHGIHVSLNAIASVRRAMPAGDSLLNCANCGEKIPEARRVAAKGCRHCIDCARASES